MRKWHNTPLLCALSSVHVNVSFSPWTALKMSRQFTVILHMTPSNVLLYKINFFLFFCFVFAAPVHKVNIQQVENRISCSSDGIYPAPTITWSTDPPSNVILQNTTDVQQTEQQLYNISRSLMLSDSVTDQVYICTVSTRRNSRRATLNKPSKYYEKDLQSQYNSMWLFKQLP